VHFAPHLLLRADAGTSRAGALLSAAGYLVSRVEEDELALRLAGSPHVDGVVVERPALATIQFGRALTARYAGIVLVVITPVTESVRRLVQSALALTPFDVADDLISTIDLALAAQQRRLLIAQHPRARAAGARE
jgi:hypothetical protein